MKCFGGLSTTDRNSHELLTISGGYSSTLQASITSKRRGTAFRFGSFNHARKLSDASIDLFAIMRACPNAELVLKSISFHEEREQKRIQRRFEQAGLPQTA